MFKPIISKLPELVIFGGPLPKSQFSAISATVFQASLTTGNIWVGGLERRSIPIKEREPELALDEEPPVEAGLSGGQTPGGGGPK